MCMPRGLRGITRRCQERIAADRYSPIRLIVRQHCLVSERVASKGAYWRMFGIVLGAHSMAIAIGVGLGGGSLGLAVYAVAAGCVVFGVWAAMAPRGAAIALAVILTVDTLSAVLVALSTHDLAVAIPIPFDVVAIVYAIRSLPLASSYLDTKRTDDQRERDYDRQERWQKPSPW
jgi:hypothetical protein